LSRSVPRDCASGEPKPDPKRLSAISEKEFRPGSPRPENKEKEEVT
jgi:hypothetical protein